MDGYIPRRFTCPWAVTHPSSNLAQRNVDRGQRANNYRPTLRRHRSI